jgi:hypothetical protein
LKWLSLCGSPGRCRSPRRGSTPDGHAGLCRTFRASRVGVSVPAAGPARPRRTRPTGPGPPIVALRPACSTALGPVESRDGCAGGAAGTPTGIGGVATAESVPRRPSDRRGETAGRPRSHGLPVAPDDPRLVVRHAVPSIGRRTVTARPIRSDRDRCDPVRSGPVRSGPIRSEPVRSAPTPWTPDASRGVRFAPARPASGRFWPPRGYRVV